MAVAYFPPVESADEQGLLAIGGDLEIDSLVLAYTQGIFPWPLGPQYPLAWFAPDPRGILRYKDLHISRSLSKELKRHAWCVRFNTCFAQVIHECAISPHRKGQNGTWITPAIIESYLNLHKAQMAFSTEVFLDGDLVGGLYGVGIGEFVAGESMFFRVPNASKIALLATMDYLQQRQVHWMDTQMLTPVVKQLGGMEMTRSDYGKLLQQSFNKGIQRSIFHRDQHLLRTSQQNWQWPRLQK
jgi:leucyl/phenylalanyl-tRNA--protein transferase